MDAKQELEEQTPGKAGAQEPLAACAPEPCRVALGGLGSTHH